MTKSELNKYTKRELIEYILKMKEINKQVVKLAGWVESC